MYEYMNCMQQVVQKTCGDKAAAWQKHATLLMLRAADTQDTCIALQLPDDSNYRLMILLLTSHHEPSLCVCSIRLEPIRT